MRGFRLGFVGLLTVALALACGGGEESTSSAIPEATPAEKAPVEAAPAKEAEEAAPEAEAEAPKADGSELECKEGLLVSYREILAKGCSFEIIDDDLAMTYRVLRNAPFAARGRKFNSPELTAYFGSEAFCAGGGTYKPEHDSVTIDPGPELDCIGKLQARENGLRQRGKQPMRKIEVYILSNPEGGIQTEARRMAGHDVMESKATFNRVQSGWTLHFYTEWMEEEFKAESSVIVMCDAKGDNCETQFAG